LHGEGGAGEFLRFLDIAERHAGGDLIKARATRLKGQRAEVFDRFAITFLRVAPDPALLDAPDRKIRLERFRFVEQLERAFRYVSNAAERRLI
jgi:hypothetical protein